MPLIYSSKLSVGFTRLSQPFAYKSNIHTGDQPKFMLGLEYFLVVDGKAHTVLIIRSDDLKISYHMYIQHKKRVFLMFVIAFSPRIVYIS